MDSNDLIMSERSGVEIDYCPQCRGVWLDRGELDKIIDRAAAQQPSIQQPAVAPQSPPVPPPPLYNNFDPHYGDDRGEQEQGRRYQDADKYQQPGYGYDRRRKKKEGWLGDLFDF